MHNYAHAHNAERVRNFRANSRAAGWSEEETERAIASLPMRPDTDAIPSSITWLNMVVTLLGAGLLIYAILLRIRD
jgi:hypothetical protein